MGTCTIFGTHLIKKLYSLIISHPAPTASYHTGNKIQLRLVPAQPHPSCPSRLRVKPRPPCSLSPRHTGLLVVQIQRLLPTSRLLLGCSSVQNKNVPSLPLYPLSCFFFSPSISLPEIIWVILYHYYSIRI